MVASPQVASAPLIVLNFCFELNFHLLAEFDIKHTLICLHTHNYWLHLPCFVHLSAPRQLNLHRGLAEEAMIKLMMLRFMINSELKALGLKILKIQENQSVTFFVLPPSSPSATSVYCL